MANPKGLISVKEAALKAFEAMPDVFYGSEVSDLCNFHTQRPQAYPATTIRKLRELRSEGVINFECISRIESKYRKIKN